MECDEHKELYWFKLLVRNSLCPVWGYVSFIDLGELKRRARNGGDYKLENIANVFF
jgi:hypothetical protein